MKPGKTNTPVAQHSAFYNSAGDGVIPNKGSLDVRAANDQRTLISFGSIAALIGFILSGPVGFLLVLLIKPQPAWTSASNFAAHYNSLQNIPYYFGFILIGGMLILAVAHYLNADKELPLDKMHVLLSVVWTTIFATLVLFNYICQIAFIHHLATNYNPDNDTAISTLSMANPASLSWAVEMCGYAILGVATWLLSAYYRNKNKTIYFLLIANGIISILSAAFFVYNDKWLLTTTGLASYFFWNILMIVLLFLIYRHSKKGTYEAA
ncbi:MAG: hypothetical protein ACJ75B_09310 [Flavisolibacter sp.]